MPLLTWEGWDDDFEPWNAEFDKEKDMFGFPYAETKGYAGFWIKESERRILPQEKLEAMLVALRPRADD